VDLRAPSPGPGALSPEAAGCGSALGAAERSSASSAQHARDAGAAAEGPASLSGAHLAPYQEGAWPMVQVPPHCVVFPTFFMPIVVHAPAAVAGAASCGEAEHASEQQYVQPGQHMVLLPHQLGDVASEALAPAAAGLRAPAPAHTGRTGASRRQRRRLLRANTAAEQQRSPQQQPSHGGSGLRPAAQAAVSKLMLGGGPAAPGASAGAAQLTAPAARLDALEPEPEAPVLWPPTPESTPPGTPRAGEAGLWAPLALGRRPRRRRLARTSRPAPRPWTARRP
ncbi:unnamed protein product, partial [Prorocentrum cordatum]